jgi:hypothetical protein
MIYTIKDCECGNRCEGRTDKCATCNREERKFRRQQLKEKAPIKPISKKRAGQNNHYLKLRKDYLEAYPACEVRECHNHSKEIHHMAGRENEKLLDTDKFLAVCHSCHHRITVDSAWAIAEGYSYKRSVSEP